MSKNSKCRVYIRINVAYPKIVIDAFNKNSPERRPAGEISHMFLQSSDAPNKILIESNFSSYDLAKKYWGKDIDRRIDIASVEPSSISFWIYDDK